MCRYEHRKETCKKFEADHTRQKNAAAKVTSPPAEDFDLSEERKKLYDEMILDCSTYDEEQLVDTVFLWLDRQDKTFIKKLKDEIKVYDPTTNSTYNMLIRDKVYEKINKLAGEKLR